MIILPNSGKHSQINLPGDLETSIDGRFLIFSSYFHSHHSINQSDGENWILDGSPEQRGYVAQTLENCLPELFEEYLSTAPDSKRARD